MSKSEYDFLLELLEPHVGNNIESLENIREDSERRDISSLNRATGLDARQIVLADQSARLLDCNEFELSREALYGCLRAGLPSDVEELVEVDPDYLKRELRKMRDAGVIALDDASISKFVTYLRKHSLRALIDLIENDDLYKVLIDAKGAIQKLKISIKKGFHLTATTIDDFFTTNEDGENDKIILEGEELESIKTLQRIYQITPCHTAMPVLKNMDINSTRDVVSLPEETFITSFEREYLEIFAEKPPAGLAFQIHRKAKVK